MSDKTSVFDPDSIFLTEELSTLSLHSLEIKNFRCFEHLVIEKLGRVNLIVGKNSVGKTSLLEGLWLLGSGASWPVIHSILYERNELVRYNLTAKSAKYEQTEAIKSFFTHPIAPNSSAIFRIGGKDAGVLEPLFPSRTDEDDTEYFDKNVTHAKETAIDFELRHDGTICIKGHPNPGYITEPELPDLPITKEELLKEVIKESLEESIVFIPVKGLPWQMLSRYWDKITLTKKESAVLNFLRTLDPSISGFVFKGDNTQDTVRFSAIRTDRFDGVVPIAKLGEGTERTFALALAMSNASFGYLLIDEFETGLHHSVQADVWRAVFKLAHEWNVQVFATTHSWDCVKAFQVAAAEDQNEEAMLIRLARRKNGQIRAVSYSEKELAIATEQDIEVR
jgi:hypothetical protein